MKTVIILVCAVLFMLFIFGGFIPFNTEYYNPITLYAEQFGLKNLGLNKPFPKALDYAHKCQTSGEDYTDGLTATVWVLIVNPYRANSAYGRRFAIGDENTLSMFIGVKNDTVKWIRGGFGELRSSEVWHRDSAYIREMTGMDWLDLCYSETKNKVQ